MGEHPDPNPAPHTGWFLSTRALVWWETSGTHYWSSLVSRLVCALSLTADAEAFYLGSYRGALFTDDRTKLPEPERDVVR